MSKICAICGKKIPWASDFQFGDFSLCPECYGSFKSWLSDDIDGNIAKIQKMLEGEISDCNLRKEIDKHLLELIGQRDERRKAEQEQLEEQQKIKQERKNEMEAALTKGEVVITTTTFFPGHEVLSILSVVSGCVAIGSGVFTYFKSSFSDFFGAESKGLARKLLEARRAADDQMKEQAESMGANAVINAAYSISNFTRDISEILATGTAVILK